MKTLRRDLRIVLAMTAKDLVDALKNKTIVSIMAGILLLVFQGRLLPLLLSTDSRQTLAIYDPSRSPFVQEIRASGRLRVYRTTVAGDMERYVTEAAEPVLGISLPEGLDAADAGSTLRLVAHYAHWVSSGNLASARAATEAILTDIAGRAVRLETAGQALYPPLDARGFPAMLSGMFVIQLVVVAIAIVPTLLLEEKEAHTLDALRVSPASMSQVTAGKLLAGFCYSLIVAAIILAINAAAIVNWGLVILAAVLLSLFAAALGLMVGAFFDHPQQVGLWTGIPLAILLVPTLMSILGGIDPSTAWGAILAWVPTVAVDRAMRMAFAPGADIVAVLPQLGLTLALTIGAIELVAWRMRRLDR